MLVYPLIIALVVLAGCTQTVIDPPSLAAGVVTPLISSTPAARQLATPLPVPTASFTPEAAIAPTSTSTPTFTPTPTSTAAAVVTSTPTPGQSPAGAVVLIIIDGARWSETFGDPESQFIPHLANDLAPLGAIDTAFYNDGRTLTVPGHAAIVTGTWQDIPNDGTVRPSAPTIFEYYRAAFDAPPSAAVFVHGSFIEPVLTYSTQPDYGPAYGAQMFFSDEPAPPYDDGMWARARQVITQLQPRLLVISLLDPDEAAHAGQWEDYLQSIRHDDEIIWDLWQLLQAEPFYAGQTTLLVTNDHGRGCGAGWRDHGGDDDCNRHVMLLAVGPAIQPGLVTSRRYTLRDIAPTVGYILGFETPFAAGEVMTELFGQK